MKPCTVIDLRSDTITQPTDGMRQAMAKAQVGDDVFGDDPTVNALQDRVADIFNKQAALFVPSGTMANQISIRAHTQPGDEIICHRNSHVYIYEAGAPAAISGCSMALLDGERGIFNAEDVCQARRADDQHFPRSSLVVVENTNNRGGGSIWPLHHIAAIQHTAAELDLRMHLDGARIMNACVATGTSPAQYAQHFDSLSLCFSKGLGAPVGSAIAGSRQFIAKAHRIRKMLGGAMRQAGILAAAANYALEHNIARLADDHRNAAMLAQLLRSCPQLSVIEPETNLLYFDVDPDWGTAEKLQTAVQNEGLLFLAVGKQRIRAVTHLHITENDVDRAAKITIKALA